MLPFCEDDLPREVCQAQVRNITCFMHKQLPGKFKLKFSTCTKTRVMPLIICAQTFQKCYH